MRPDDATHDAAPTEIVTDAAADAAASRVVVLHVTGDPGDGGLEKAVRSATNLRQVEPDADVRIVLQGPVVSRVAGRAASVPELPTGVRIVACRNSLRGSGLSSDDVASGVEVAPAAVAYLARAQWEGAAYIAL